MMINYTPDCPFCVLYGTDKCIGNECYHYKTYMQCKTCRYKSDEWDSPMCDGCESNSHYERNMEGGEE